MAKIIVFGKWIFSTVDRSKNVSLTTILLFLFYTYILFTWYNHKIRTWRGMDNFYCVEGTFDWTVVRRISIHAFVERSRSRTDALSRESLKRKGRGEEYNETRLRGSKPSNESNNERFSEMTNAIWYRTSREDKDIDWRVRVSGKVASLIHGTIPFPPEPFPRLSSFYMNVADGSVSIFFRVISLSACDATVIVPSHVCIPGNSCEYFCTLKEDDRSRNTFG